MPGYRLLQLGAMLLLALAAVAVLVSAGGGAARAAAGKPSAATPRLARAPRATAPISFSHAVVVDEQRPGFEPDVKTDTNNVIYSSVPFGFSTTQSFIWSSHDNGNSYQFVPGTVGPGKPITCVGGGDTDLYLDAKNALYFSDLQGLTNISVSMSTDGGTTFTTNCASAPNTPDDRMWFAGSGSSAGGNLVLYQDYDATDTAANLGNQLVETVSTDGTHFQPVVNTNAAAFSDTSGGPDSCAGAAVDNCVTNDEGISGNQVVDPKTNNVFIAHTTTEGSSGEVGVRVSEGKISLGTPTTASWSESPNLDGPLCPDKLCVDKSGNAEELAGENFASMARDSAGYLYVTFTAGPLDHANANDPNFGALTAPEQIYVVHSLQPVGADPSKLTWSAPQKISGSGLSAGTNTFPWITAGSDGRVAVAWYHSDETSESGTCASGSGTCKLHGASSLQNAEWSVQLGESLDAHAASPAYTTATVSEAPVKYGQICTNGIGCVTGGDRSLGDFLQVAPDAHGAALVSYVDDTSADESAGEAAGPEVISRQISGPSLFAADGDVTQGAGPGVPMGSVTDPTGDAFYSANGARTAAGDNLDITGASLANGPGRTLTATIRVKSLADLTASPAIGGPDASWLIRWKVLTPGKVGNGHIYYAGMDNNGSGSPTFFDGDTAGVPASNPEEHTKYIAYPPTNTLSAAQGSYDAKTGVITMHIPLSDVGNPAAGTPLYSVTAFSATSITPQSNSTLFNLIDAATPFDLVIGAPGTVGTPQEVMRPAKSLPPSKTGGPRKAACPVAPGRLRGTSLGPLRLGITRARARHTYTHWSTRSRRNMDFFCLRPTGIRVGYATAAMVRSLPRAQRKRAIGTVVVLLSANHGYDLRRLRTGEKITTARRLHIKISRPIRIGANVWYTLSNGPSRGILKVHHGVIEEIGIADKRFTRNLRASKRFLSSFD